MKLRDALRESTVSEIVSSWRVVPVEGFKMAKKNRNEQQAAGKVKGKKHKAAAGAAAEILTPAAEILTPAAELTGISEQPVADSQQIETATPPPQNPPPIASAVIQEIKVMTLSLKSLDKRGRNGIYTGAAVAIRIPVGAFPDKNAPASIEIADGVLAGPKERKSRASMTPEERKAARAAQPKLTLAEKVAKAEERAAKLREKLAKDAQAQPSL